MSSSLKFFGYDPLVFAIPVSLALHAGAYAMGFRLPEYPESPKPPVFDVTMVIPSDAKTPEKADYIANSSQQGSGSKEKKTRIKSSFASDETNLENGEELLTSEKTVAEVIPKEEPEILTTKGKTDKVIEKLPEEKPQEEVAQATVDTSEQTEAIRKLMAEMSQQEERYAKRPRIHFIDSLSAKGAVEAKYIHDWAKKLERIGNINFPKKAIALSLSGTLILNATLDRMGRVVEIQVSVSSGSKILDTAAIKIVKLAAPYEPFPREIRKKYDRLNITRTIIFHKGNDGEASFYSK